MPTQPLRPCPGDGYRCPELVTDGRCPAHAEEHDRTRRPEWVTRFYSSSRWKKVRDWKRRHSPLCEQPVGVTTVYVVAPRPPSVSDAELVRPTQAPWAW